MSTKPSDIVVLSTDMFGPGNDVFWISSLEGLLEKYPLLERPHRQLFFTLLCIENAHGNAVIDGIAIRIDQPKVIFVKPGSVFSIDVNRMANGTIICFTEDFFSLRYNNNALFHFFFMNKENNIYMHLEKRRTSEWKLLCRYMLEEFNTQQKDVDSVLRSFLNILLCKLDRQFNPVMTNEKWSSKEEKIRQFQLLLDEHFIKHKTPSFYAGQLNITTNYLNKICRKYKGLSGGEFIRKRITVEAQRLLHYSARQVSEIAKDLEFESVSYFITFFKRNTGMTPDSFRKNHQ